MVVTIAGSTKSMNYEEAVDAVFIHFAVQLERDESG
jgi:hypothetical protein